MDTQGVLDILGDLSRWDLFPESWERIRSLLVGLDEAVEREDADAVADALVQLELLSPRREVQRLGERQRAPRPVQLVANRLVHRVGRVTVDPTVGLPFETGPVPPTTTAVVEQEIVVHRFAALDGDRADAAYAQLHRAWDRCRRQFAMTEPVAEIDLAGELPEATFALPSGPIVAAVTTVDLTAQATLWRDHDVLALSVLIGGAGWPELDERWDACCGGDSDALLGGARLYLGRAPAGVTRLGVDLDPERTVPLAGCQVIDLTTPGDAWAERRLVVLGDVDPADPLSALVWSPSPSTSPLGRYLLHAAKLRYETRVRRCAGETIEVADGGGDQADLEADLADLRTTASVALRNMGRLIAPTDVGFLGDDQEFGQWLIDQVDADLQYLSRDRRRRVATSRTRGGPRPDERPTVGIVTAMPEELAAITPLLVDARPGPPHPDDPSEYLRATLPSSDRDQPHAVVVSQLAGTATASAAEAVAHLIRSYPSVREVIMMGVAAGCPNPTEPARHVRLGDILVATYGVVAYDHIVDRPSGPDLRQSMPRPSMWMTRRANRLRQDAELGQRPWEALLDHVIARQPWFARPDPATDELYDGDSDRRLAHPDVIHSGHASGRPKVHYGRIGSGDRSLRHAANRDELARRFELLGFEMEGSGVGTAASSVGRHWFVVRGVSDYADHHMTTGWRRYASAAAAAYVAALLAVGPPVTGPSDG